MSRPPHTVAVLITYRPEIPLLETNLPVICNQADGLVLVDNGSGDDLTSDLRTLLAGQAGISAVQSLFQPDNLGLGQALNAGIAMARTGPGATHVVLFDQDSRPAPDMVATLHHALGVGEPGAVAGPAYNEPGRPTPPPFSTNRGDGITETESLITSGLLLPVALLDRVGPFDEGLFMDMTDTDWCFRARAAGVRCYGVAAARMSHRIGDRVLRLGTRHMAVHAPVRTYYQLRNLLLLARRPATPRWWLLRVLPRYLMRSLILVLAGPHRARRAGAALRGLWHGFAGRTGPWQ